MIDRTKVLNWSIGSYIIIRFIGYYQIIKAAPSLRILFVLIPFALLAWEIILITPQITQRDEDETELPFYERIESGDWWRLFGITWIGYTPIATDYIFGFFLFSAFVFVLFGLLVFTVSVEFFRKKSLTPLAIGCLIFGYLLLTWEKNVYVEHYGVPIVGHFFEKPEYNTKYRVEVEPEGSNTKIKAIADIHVEGRTETEDTGAENWYGQPITQTSTYRDVWVKKIYLPNGKALNIDIQDEPLTLNESVFVEDSNGRSWYIRLLNEPIP